MLNYMQYLLTQMNRKVNGYEVLAAKDFLVRMQKVANEAKKHFFKSGTKD